MQWIGRHKAPIMNIFSLVFHDRKNHLTLQAAKTTAPDNNIQNCLPYKSPLKISKKHIT